MARDRIKSEATMMKLKVLYKLPKQKQVTQDWVCNDLKELLHALSLDGITKESVEFMYVHYTPVGDPSAEVMEIVSVENRPGVDKAVSNVIKMERKAKPHIKLTAKDVDPPKPVIYYGSLYNALQV